MSDDPNKPAPEDDIGPYYRALGAILTVGAVALFVIHAHHNQAFSWIDFGMFCVVGLLILALIRPRFFDSTVKTIADKLPGPFSKSGP